MKKTSERTERLAAEYVLGSLQGRARKRFERWMMESARVRQEVWYWEEKLGELVTTVPAITPAPSVWTSIERRIWPSTQASSPARTPEPKRAGWFWPGWSFLATTAAMVLAVVLVQQPQHEQQPRLSGAVVQTEVADPLWLVSELSRDNQLRLRPVAVVAAERDKDYELWAVPAEGNPLSLGVMDVGAVYQVTLSDEARALLSKSRTLAISLEPRGGSPTGAPSGPILHITTLYEM